MKERQNIWPELIIGALLLLVILGLVTHSTVPTTVSEILYGTPTPAPTMTSTPAPVEGVVFVKIETVNLTQLESFGSDPIADEGIPARLVIITKSERISAGGEVTTEIATEEFSVTLSAFLDKNDVRMESFSPDNTVKVLISLAIDDLPRYGQTIQTMTQMYLVGEPESIREP